MQETYPAETISLRSASPDNVVIVDSTEQEKVINRITAAGKICSGN